MSVSFKLSLFATLLDAYVVNTKVIPRYVDACMGCLGGGGGVGINILIWIR